MGNIGSHSGQITQQQRPEEQWNHSFPRTQARLHQFKVVPEKDARQRLRHTNNGDILQSGGTLSGRHHQNRLSLREESSGPQQERLSRTYLPNQRDPHHKTGARYTQAIQNGYNPRENLKKFGSEPDLRQAKNDYRVKARKKYKAPSPPKTKNDWDECETTNRRTRLFKTRAETKNTYSSPVQNHEEVQMREGIKNDVDLKTNNRLSLPEMSFHQELQEVIKRQRHFNHLSDENTVLDIKNTPNNKEKLKTLDPTKDNLRQRFKQLAEEADGSKALHHEPRGDGSGKESSSPERLSPRINQPKTFYFGMDESPAYNLPELGRPPVLRKISSESDISSELELDEAQNANGIDLQLRPILPKKQLEVPRFSPAAAWRLLSVDSIHDSTASDDLPVFVEERIEKYSRPPPPNIQFGQRSTNDKSGDSGISGDAGPVGYDDTPEAVLPSRSFVIPQKEMSWTPQQDLGDDSSIEEGIDDSYERQKYSNKPHVFSLSLPREGSYMTDRIQYLPKMGTKKELLQSNFQDQDNWFLSKSAPNSLNNGFNSLELKRNDDKEIQVQVNSKSSGRLVYLPQLETRQDPRPKQEWSKSCGNLPELKSSSEPEDLQDPIPKPEPKNLSRKTKRFTFQSTVRQIERRRLAEKLSREAERKEKQRLRELEAMQKVEEEFQKKRAREKASIRQQLRLFSVDDVPWTSLPPNLEVKDEPRPEPDGAVSSSNSSPSYQVEQPKKIYQKNKQVGKHRPSSESSEDTRIKAQVTQVLSEYRHPQRDYKEYTGSTRYLNELNDGNHAKTTVIHPRVTCNMPKAHQSSNKTSGTNYRKDFAHGVKSTRSGGSSYSEDSQSRNNSPRMYHNQYGPMTRF